MKLFALITFILLILACAGTGDASCRFSSTPTPLNFGNLNPANSIDVNATSTVTIRCNPSVGLPNPAPYTISDDSGLYSLAPGQLRMRNATNIAVYLPYTFTYATSGIIPLNTNMNITFTGTVRAIDYQNAWAGNYSDTVTITINP